MKSIDKNENFAKVTDFVIKILIMMIAAGVGYFITKIDKIDERLHTIEINQANDSNLNISSAGQYDKFDKKLDLVGENIEKIELSLQNLKTTQTMTWNKVLDLDARLRAVEDEILKLKQSIYRRP